MGKTRRVLSEEFTRRSLPSREMRSCLTFTAGGSEARMDGVDEGAGPLRSWPRGDSNEIREIPPKADARKRWLDKDEKTRATQGTAQVPTGSESAHSTVVAISDRPPSRSSSSSRAFPEQVKAQASICSSVLWQICASTTRSPQLMVALSVGRAPRRLQRRTQPSTLELSSILPHCDQSSAVTWRAWAASTASGLGLMVPLSLPILL
mmetsp:Transcript_26559/g.77333  ORF Transcript_26559/g.77333 Transcript_26559/m.77333 type:complete len:207 (-) Transcript_26559:144-764(-)